MSLAKTRRGCFHGAGTELHVSDARSERTDTIVIDGQSTWPTSIHPSTGDIEFFISAQRLSR
jgi:hypothetical protein